MDCAVGLSADYADYTDFFIGHVLFGSCEDRRRGEAARATREGTNA